MDDNKIIARRWMDAFNQGDTDAVGQLFDADVVEIIPHRPAYQPAARA